jgi:hypothetical protein
VAANDIAICNSGLSKLGSLRITAMNDQTEHARLVNEQFNKLRKDLLRSHPWNFATKEVALVAATDPVFKYSAAFTLPVDCLRVISTSLYEDDEWGIEGNTLVCNASTVSIEYIYDVTDTTKFTSDFDELLALKIAHDLSYPLTQSTALKDQLYKEMVMKERLVRSFDAQEGTGKRVTARRLLNARRSRGY